MNVNGDFRLPRKSGKFTPREKAFVAAMAGTQDGKYAATVAGYRLPGDAWSNLMRKPLIAEATREAGQRLLREKAGAVAIVTLLEIATDTMQPANARVTASKYLSDAAGMRIGTESSDKSPAEMTAAELQRAQADLERKLAILESARADAARPIIDGSVSAFE